MAKPSPQEFFEILFPDDLIAGQLPLYTTTVRRGNDHISWCHNVPEADRLCINYRQTRRVRSGVALHSSQRALAIVRQSRGRAQPGSARGCEASVSALSALWAKMPYRPEDPATCAHPASYGFKSLPELRQALDLMVAFDPRPSILFTTGRNLCAFWLLDRPWVFNLKDDTAADKAAARALLCRLQWAIACLAAEHGWPMAVAGDLAADFPVPGSLTGNGVKGPKATLLAFPMAAGDGRYRRRELEALPELPADDPRPWLKLAEQLASAGEPEPVAKPPADVERHGPGCRPSGLIARPVELPRPRTRIVITCRQHEVNDQAMAALAAGAELFEQDSALVELVRTPGAAPRVLPVRGPRLRELLSRLCQFVLESGERVGGEPREVPPPRWTVGALLTRGRWPELPRLASSRLASPRLENTRLARVRAGDSAPLVAPVPALVPEPPVVPDPPPKLTGVDFDGGLLAALDRVLETLGGAATARRIAGALAAEPERFSELVAAMKRLWPELEPGDPVAATALGYRFRGLKGRVCGGLTLIEARRTQGGVAWAVRHAEVSPLANNRKEAA